jgi:hypothetical protein
MTLTEALKLTNIVIKEAETCRLTKDEVSAIRFLQTFAMKRFLVENGWIEVPGENGGTAWMIDVAGTPHYFALEAAYELDSNGTGRYSLAGDEALIGLLRANDVVLGEAQEAAYYAEHGVTGAFRQTIDSKR